MMMFTELIGGMAIIAGLYYIGVIISRCIILAAKRQEVEMAEREVNIKKEQLKLLDGKVYELGLIGDGEEQFIKETNRITREKLEVIIGGKFEHKNRW